MGEDELGERCAAALEKLANAADRYATAFEKSVEFTNKLIEQQQATLAGMREDLSKI